MSDALSILVSSSPLVTGLLAIPGVYWAYRAGLRKQLSEAELQRRKADAELEQQRDKADLDALAARERTIESLQGQLMSLNQKLIDFAHDNGALSARLLSIEQHQHERDARERLQLEKLGALQAKITRFESCAGGSPCPFRRHEL